MLDRNSALIANLRQVSSDIAHDLRTPIAHLRQRLERVAGRMPLLDPQRKEIEGAIAQSDAILSLFAALLRISEVESGALRRYFQPVDLSAIVRTICESYSLAAEDGGRTLSWAVEGGVWITGDRELLGQALVNLIENSMRHTPIGTSISASLTLADGTAVLILQDNGPGIDEAQLPKVTERFVRIDKARSAPGFGLGLNLVAAIVKAHDGLFVLENRHPGLFARAEFARTN
jgi:signal transduction histidine kinase